MATKSNQGVECELYVARFRRNLMSLTKAINNPKKTLQRVVIKSRRTGQPVAVMLAPGAYEKTAAYLAAHKHKLSEQAE